MSARLAIRKQLDQKSWLISWRPKKFALAIGLLISGVVVFTYRATHHVFFVQDDFWFLQAAQKPWPNEFLYGGVLPDYWRPLSTYWFHWFNITLFGMEAIWHHVILLGIFGLTVLFWGIALYEITGSYLAEIAGALVYGVSRLHLYTLGWISGVIDILAALFLVLTLFFIWRGERKTTPVWLIGLALSLGLLSKEPVILLVPLTFLAVPLNAKLFQKRLTRWEKQLIGCFLGVGGVYMLGWFLHTNGQRSSSEIGLYWRRGYTLLGNAISGIIPTLDFQEYLPWIWFLLPLLLVVITLTLEKTAGMAGVFWGLGLYGLPVLPFVLFDQPFLQPYYAHFSMLGLSLLLAQSLAAVWRMVRTTRFHRVVMAIGGVGILGYLIIASQAVESGIKSNQSPALFEAQYSKAAYNQITNHCLPEDSCQTLIFLDMTDLMWWSIGKGVMVPVMFPGVQADFDGYFGYQAPIGATSTETVIVLRQVSDKEFEIVR